MYGDIYKQMLFLTILSKYSTSTDRHFCLHETKVKLFCQCVWSRKAHHSDSALLLVLSIYDPQQILGHHQTVRNMLSIDQN